MGNEAEFHRFGRENLLNGGLGQIKAHEDDDDGYDQPRHIFRLSVPKRMLAVGFAAGDLEPQQGDHRRACVRKVVEGVGGNGDGMRDQPRQILCRKQDRCSEQPHRAAEHAVASAHGGVVVFPGFVEDDFRQKTNHAGPLRSILYAAAGANASVAWVADLLHMRYVIRPQKQRRRGFAPGEDDFGAPAQPFDRFNQFLLRKRARRAGGKRLVQNDNPRLCARSLFAAVRAGA